MKKFRIISLIIVALVAVLSLASCASDVTAYSPDTRVSIVRSDLDATEADVVAFNKIVSTVQAHIGSNCRSITDTLRQSNFEIVVGESNREVTRLAKEYLAANTPMDGDAESYVFYYKDNSIAVVASSEFAMKIAVEVFIERYLNADTLVVRSDMLDFKSFSKTAYIEEQDALITAAEEESWEHRWDKLLALVGTEATEAVQRLYEFWGTEWLEWAAGLYDPEVGGFYYAASARDYYGFLPDIESTAQILNLLKEFGLYRWYKDGSWYTALPDDFRQGLATFVQEMQDEADGYFYHPQWGKNIGSSAKGRHLSQALYILEVAGVKPYYRTPLETDDTAMGGTSSVIAAFMETDEHQSSIVWTASTLPDFMQSEEALIAYLDEQWAEHWDDKTNETNSYGFGHLLSSQANQLKASGFIDVVCDWLDAHQDPNSGFWEPITTENPDSGYRAISGLIKISGVYGQAGRAFNYADKMVDAAIDIMLDDRAPAHVCYIYNPIGAYKSILSSMKLVGLDLTEAKQKFYYKMPEILDTVIEKQQVFRKELGSFSYVPTRSDPTSQGVRISLGFAEGDVNATAVSMHYVCDGLFGVLGIGIIPMFRYSDYKWFFQQIADSTPPVKSDLVLEVLDFEDGDVPSRVLPSSNADYELEVVDNGREGDDAGQALQITTGGGSSAVTTIEMKSAITPTCTSVELDMNFVESAKDGHLYSLYIENQSNTRIGYQLQFNITASGMVEIKECSNDPDSSKNYSHALASVPMGEWFNLRVEYYPESTTDLHVKIYVNDECVYVSQKTYYCVYSPWVVYSGMNLLRFSCFGGNATTVMLDNIECIHDASKTYDGSDYIPR